MAKIVMPEAEWMLSLAQMLRRWVATVCTDRKRLSAISLFERPRAMAAMMSRSRGVRSMSPLASRPVEAAGAVSPVAGAGAEAA